MRVPLLLVLLPCCVEALRVVVTFGSTSDRINAASVSPAGVVLKSFGRRHVLQLENVSFPEAQRLLPLTYLPFGLVSVEEDLFMWASTGTAPVNGSTGQATLQWNLFGEWGLSLRPGGVRMASRSAVLAILDSGFTPYSGGYDFISDMESAGDGDGRDPDASDVIASPGACLSSWHGTQMASIVRGSPALGLSGIAENSTLLSVRVLGECDRGMASDITDGIVWAAGGVIDGVETNPLPARIISMSLTGKGACPSYLQSAVRQAIRLGAILVASAGNMAEDAALYFPGNCEGVVSVGGTTVHGALAAYSNWNATLYAPGGDAYAPIAVEALNGTLRYVSGTSLSAAHVSGMLVLSSLESSSVAGPSFIAQSGDSVSNASDGGNALGLYTVQLSDCWAPKCAPRSLVTTGLSSNTTGQCFVWKVAPAASGTIETGIIAERGGVDMLVTGQASKGYYYHCGGISYFVAPWNDAGCQGLGYPAGGYPRYDHYDFVTDTLYGSYECCCSCSWLECGATVGTYYTTGGTCDTTPCTNKPTYSSYSSAFLNLGTLCPWTCDAGCTTTGGYLNSGTCTACPCQAGETGPMKPSCTACATGTYKTTTGSATCTACATCPAGQYIPDCGGTSAGSCTVCGTCPAGYYRSGCTGTSAGSCNTTCATCSAGQYMNGCTGVSAGSCTACATCPAGQYMNGCTGASAGSCATCSTCPAGQYGSGCTGASAGSCVACAACAAGEDRMDCGGLSAGACVCFPGLSTPTACSAGTVCAITGLTAPGQCASGYYCASTTSQVICPAGSYCPAGVTAAVTCPVGSTCAATGLTTPTPCSAGTYGTGVGRTSAEGCTACNAGAYSTSLGLTASQS